MRPLSLSYSSKDDPEALTIRDAVYAALKTAGHAVFLDAREAGVILFTRGALTSDWVWQEASSLSFVREFASTFKLISVPLQNVKLEDLKTPRFAPLGLEVGEPDHRREWGRLRLLRYRFEDDVHGGGQRPHQRPL